MKLRKSLADHHRISWGRPSALLCSLELAMANPTVARLAANRFLAGCILRYIIEGVLTYWRYSVDRTDQVYRDSITEDGGFGAGQTRSGLLLQATTMLFNDLKKTVSIHDKGIL